MEATGSGRNPEQTAGYATRTKPSSVTLTFSSVIASRALRLLIDAAGERDTHSILTSPPATAFVPGHCPLRASERERENKSESESERERASERERERARERERERKNRGKIVDRWWKEKSVSKWRRKGEKKRMQSGRKKKKKYDTFSLRATNDSN